jgi:integrase
MPAKKMPDDVLVAAVHDYLETAPASALRQRLAAQAIGVSQSLIAKVSAGQWESWRHEALAKRVTTATLDARAAGRFPSLQEVSRRSGLTMNQVQHGFADVVAVASGIDPSTPPARRHPDERHARLEAVLESTIAAATDREDLVWSDICDRANHHPTRVGAVELKARLRRAKASLPARASDPVDPSESIRIDNGRQSVISRASLRGDIAVIGWPLVRATAMRAEGGSSAALALHRSLRAAGELLGDSSPDIESLSLTQIQGSAASFGGSQARKRQGRRGLLLLIEAMLSRAVDSNEDGTELSAIDEWLRSLSAQRLDPREDALTAEQSELLVEACLAVIARGREQMSAIANILDHSNNSKAIDNVAVVADWGIALMIIVARFTGLRARSLATLRPTDLYEIGPDTFALLWRHEKKVEEHVAVVPASVAFLIKDYAEALAPIRSYMDCDYVFVGRGRFGTWSPLADGQNNRIPMFLKRHAPTLADKRLTITALRRTFATRALAEGRSVFAVAAQLGHRSIASTLHYARFERLAHPVEVGPALDRFGRVVLERWRSPVVADDLTSDERAQVFAHRAERDCGVGLCRAGTCVMTAAGQSPPPCTACSFLVTDETFFPAWDEELAGRRRRLAVLDADLALGTVAANERVQIAEIERIYVGLRERLIS